MRYAYGLIPDSSDTATIRWEYVRSPAAGADWCRHHVQGPIEIVLNRAETTLNGLHVPTGYVPFEEIIRFCIVDLEVPSISEDWRAVLHDSYEQFRRDFVQA